MKRGFIFLVFLLFLIISIHNTFAIYVSGHYVHVVGEATSNQVNASIIVVNIAPTIFIFSPKENRTYRSKNILLNYSVYDPDGISLVWYNIDNTNNISLGNSSSGYIYFNTSQGMHTLYLYANDTFGAENFSSVNFFVNNTKIIVIYEEFRKEKKGNSTDFDSLTDEQLENLSNMIIESTDYGKILWREHVNITADRDPSDRITILDNNVVIANASIFVNEIELPNLNKKATLWFYNLSFKNPRVLRNGEVCPSSVCSNLVYQNKTLRVDVTGFTNYSVEEIPEQPEAPGGVGGGRGSTPTRNASRILFFFYPSLIKLNLMQGGKEMVDIKIINLDTEEIEFQLDSHFGMVSIGKKNFSLKPEEEKEITLYINVPIDAKPDVYIDNIFITAKKGDQTRTEKLKIVIVVSAEKKIFDVKVKVLEEYKIVKAGTRVIAEIEIYNLGIVNGTVDVESRYDLRDLENNILQQEIKSVAVQTKVSEVIKLLVPKRTTAGRYLFTASVTYNGQKAFASDDFYVEEERKTINPVLPLIIVIAILIGVFVWIGYKKIKQAQKISRILVLSKIKLR